MKKKKGKEGTIGIKLDMRMAYDSMEWNFLLRVLRAFGMAEEAVNLIGNCISIGTAEVLLDGTLIEPISPERGLRQGDPLSPYLFIIRAEVLSRLLEAEQNSEKIHGISIGRRAPTISHLMFVDDTMIFCWATTSEVGTVLRCLQKY